MRRKREPDRESNVLAEQIPHPLVASLHADARDESPHLLTHVLAIGGKEDPPEPPDLRTLRRSEQPLDGLRRFRRANESRLILRPRSSLTLNERGGSRGTHRRVRYGVMRRGVAVPARS